MIEKWAEIRQGKWKFELSGFYFITETSVGSQQKERQTVMSIA